MRTILNAKNVKNRLKKTMNIEKIEKEKKRKKLKNFKETIGEQWDIFICIFFLSTISESRLRQGWAD